jgi:hypothetical protein
MLLVWLQGGGVVAKTLTADPGSYVLTGTAAGTYYGKRVIDSTGGTYALTGTDPTRIGHGFFIDATTAGSYALTGTAATPFRNLPMVAGGGTYLLTGTDASPKVGFKVDATTAGVYTLTGTDVALAYAQNKAIAAGVGSYALTGTDVTLTLFSNNKTLVADPGSYSLVGTDPVTTHQWKLDATTAGSYSLAGQVADLLHKWRLDATTPGAYSLTGTDAGTLHGWRVIDSVGGTYSLTGSDVSLSLISGKFVTADSGVYALTGTDATLTQASPNKFITADPGNYALIGTNVALVYQPTAPAIVLPTRGEWPEKDRKKRRKQRNEVRDENIRAARRARDALRESLSRLYDGGSYDAPVEALEAVAAEAQATASAVSSLTYLPQSDLQVIEDLIERIREVVRQRLLDDRQAEVATQIAQLHLDESIEAAGNLYRQTRQNYLIKTLLLIAE